MTTNRRRETMPAPSPLLHNIRLLKPCIFILLVLSLVSLASAVLGEDDLPDNPGLRLPYSEADAPRVGIEEAMHYRHPGDYSNQKATSYYSRFHKDCGGDKECKKHFPDSYQATTPHKAIDYLDTTGGTFTVYAGIVGQVERINKDKSYPEYCSVIVKAKIKGGLFHIEYAHLAAETLRVVEKQKVFYGTPIGQMYVERNPVWILDGVAVKGYCGDDGSSSPLSGYLDKRCYPAHLHYQVTEMFGDYAEPRDPYDICGTLRESNFDSCKAYHYPGNRFGTEAKPLGPHHLWELTDDRTGIKTAVPR